MTVDAHAHLVPPGLVEAVGGGAVPGVRVSPDGGSHRFELADSAPTRPVPPPLLDVEQRLAWMDEQGIEHQLVGSWADLFGYELDPDAGVAWVRTINETLLEATGDHKRLVPLGTLPLQDVDAACGLLDAGELDGFAGVMISTRVRDRELDDESFTPVWERLGSRGLGAFVHPGFGQDPRLRDYGLVNAVGRGQDTATAGARLLCAGVPTRFPDTPFVLAHGGGTLPFLLGRLRRNHALHADTTADPDVNFRVLFFDSVVFDPKLLELLCGQAGVGQLVCGSDYPFPIGDPEPTRVVHDADLDAADRDAILSGNVRRAFPRFGEVAR